MRQDCAIGFHDEYQEVQDTVEILHRKVGRRYWELVKRNKEWANEVTEVQDDDGDTAVADEADDIVAGDGSDDTDPGIVFPFPYNGDDDGEDDYNDDAYYASVSKLVFHEMNLR